MEILVHPAVEAHTAAHFCTYRRAPGSACPLSAPPPRIHVECAPTGPTHPQPGRFHTYKSQGGPDEHLGRVRYVGRAPKHQVFARATSPRIAVVVHRTCMATLPTAHSTHSPHPPPLTLSRRTWRALGPCPNLACSCCLGCVLSPVCPRRFSNVLVLELRSERPGEMYSSAHRARNRRTVRSEEGVRPPHRCIIL